MTYELIGKRILIVEGEPILAQDLANQMTAEGAQVIGPVGTVEAALNVIVSTNNLDGAILDIKLIEKMSFKVADVLAARRVPKRCSPIVPRGLPARLRRIGTWNHCHFPLVFVLSKGGSYGR